MRVFSYFNAFIYLSLNCLASATQFMHELLPSLTSLIGMAKRNEVLDLLKGKEG